MDPFRVGSATITPRLRGDALLSLGRIQIDETDLRSDQLRFLPWFDTLDGEVFHRFRFREMQREGERVTLHCRALSDPDAVFMERRDTSGDPILRQRHWDAPALEADFRVVFEPVPVVRFDDHVFHGYRYWYEYADADLPIHRLLDRQTWEPGGSSAGNTVVCRNLFDLPTRTLGPEVGYSTTGLGHYVGLLPGNLWGRWTLLPPFDMQVGPHGVLLGWFDRCTLIRSVIEALPGEDFLKVLDFHYFAKANAVATNPKTILHCPDVLDSVDTLNLWTRVHEAERLKFRQQYGMRDEGPPRVVFSHNVWRGFHFDRSYDEVVDEAAAFGAEIVFIDSVWENGETVHATVKQEIGEARLAETVLSKVQWQNMCCTLDFAVSQIAGGEDGLRRLCDRAAAKGVQVTSWMSTHYTPWSTLRSAPELQHGLMGPFAARESGRHPDTGYPGECWTLNLNNPALYQKLREQILGVCERTGLHGYLWDSFCNLGWWQIDHSAGTLAPQVDRMAQLYADIINAGLFLNPEAIVSFSTNSTIGLHGGNVYAGDNMGYAYCTGIGLHYAEPGEAAKREQDHAILRGERPLDLYFRCVSHLRLPGHELWRVPPEERDPDAFAAIRELLLTYRAQRHLLQRRTVLKDDRGVRYDNDVNTVVFFSYRHQHSPIAGDIVDAASSAVTPPDALRPNRVYLITPPA